VREPIKRLPLSRTAHQIIPTDEMQSKRHRHNRECHTLRDSPVPLKKGFVI